MKIAIVLLTMFLCFFTCCCSGEPRQNYYQPPVKEIKPYDPEKAGAVIVSSYDITDNIAFLETGKIGHITEKTNYDLAVYKNSLYIRIRNILYIFDKNSMQKLREIVINLPHEYNFLPYSDPGYAISNGLAVIGSQVFMLFMDHDHRPYKVYLFNLNLNTGKTQYINEEKLGIKFNNGIPNMMGYDQQRNAIWFRIEDYSEEASGVYYYYFQYDTGTKTFTRIDEAVWSSEVGWAKQKTDPRADPPRCHLIATSISGNECWNVYIYSMPRRYEEAFFVVDRRSMDSLTEPAGSIDVEYLGTFSLPQSIIYDNPYIWMLVERNDRMQMLKLLPNEQILPGG